MGGTGLKEVEEEEADFIAGQKGEGRKKTLFKALKFYSPPSTLACI